MNLSENGIIIRRTSESDLRQVYLLSHEEPLSVNIPFPVSPENLAEIFADKNTIHFTAVRKKKVLGFVSCSVKGSESEINWIFVAPKLRRKSIGSSLLARSMEELKHKGAAKLKVSLMHQPDNSDGFFSNIGFSVEKTFNELGKIIL